MKQKAVGSNQFQDKYKSRVFGHFDKVLAVLLFAYLMFLAFNFTKSYATGMATDHWLGSLQYGVQPTVYFQAQLAPTKGILNEEEMEATKENIVWYIMKVFGKHGTDVAVKAISCFYSESGLRTEAYNFNSNGTEDRGVAQINSIHGLRPEDAHNYRKNIDMAERVFVRAGNSFRPWYGQLCK
jgi:hypothetical protein